jgi:hypothetical protein
MSASRDAVRGAMLRPRIILHNPNASAHGRGNRAYLFCPGICGESREKFDGSCLACHGRAGAAPRFATPQA